MLPVLYECIFTTCDLIFYMPVASHVNHIIKSRRPLSEFRTLHAVFTVVVLDTYQAHIVPLNICVVHARHYRFLVQFFKCQHSLIIILVACGVLFICRLARLVLRLQLLVCCCFDG